MEQGAAATHMGPVTDAGEWARLRPVNRDGNTGISRQELQTIRQTLSPDGTPSREQIQAYVASLGLTDTGIANRLIEALFEPNTPMIRFTPSRRDLATARQQPPASQETRRPTANGPAKPVPPLAATGRTSNLEDGSFNARTVELYYSKGAWEPEVSLSFIIAMAEVGGREGFDVTVAVPPDARERLETDLAAVASPSARARIRIQSNEHLKGDVWTQDNGEYVANGSVVLPLAVPAGMKGAIEAALDRDRAARGLTVPILTTDVASLAARSEAKRTSAQQAGAQVIGGATFIEGGNVLTGLGRDGKPYALVGRDTLTINRALFDAEGRHLSDQAIIALIAQDLGVEADHVHLIEQPADFHLDMGITPLPGNEVLINDAMQVFELQSQWLRADHAAAEPPANDPRHAAWQTIHDHLETVIAGMREAAVARAATEAMAVRDLQQAGFTVHRVPGVYPKATIDFFAREGTSNGGIQRMNFMNAVQMQSDRGGRVSVMLGGDPRAEAAMLARMREVAPQTAQHTYFLHPDLTDKTLWSVGGINCRVKLREGRVESEGLQAALHRRAAAQGRERPGSASAVRSSGAVRSERR